MLVSTTQRESAVKCTPSTSPTPLGHHRAPGWVPCIIQQLPNSYLFYTWYSILNLTLLSFQGTCLLSRHFPSRLHLPPEHLPSCHIWCLRGVSFPFWAKTREAGLRLLQALSHLPTWLKVFTFMDVPHSLPILWTVFGKWTPLHSGCQLGHQRQGPSSSIQDPGSLLPL